MTARYKSRMYDTEDQAREAFDLLEWAGVHARVVGPIRTFVVGPDDCGFCHGQPVGNAARWTNSNAPDTAPCPRCGRTVEEIEEWEVNIVVPAEQSHPARPVHTADVEPHEDDAGRSTIWDELEESRD